TLLAFRTLCALPTLRTLWLLHAFGLARGFGSGHGHAARAQRDRAEGGEFWRQYAGVGSDWLDNRHAQLRRRANDAGVVDGRQAQRERSSCQFVVNADQRRFADEWRVRCQNRHYAPQVEISVNRYSTTLPPPASVDRAPDRKNAEPKVTVGSTRLPVASV